MTSIKLKTPLDPKQISNLKTGDIVSLSGTIIGARDAAHKRMILAIKNGEKLPLDLKNATIFYLGPSPTPPGKVCGSIGPTTSARMDSYAEPLLKVGLKAMIGKGKRSNKLKEILKKYGAIYFVAPGGVAAYLSKKVKKIDAIAYQDLGHETIYSLFVEDFPLIVAYDIFGGDIFK